MRGKKWYILFAMALLVISLSFVMTGCRKNQKDNKGGSSVTEQPSKDDNSLLEESKEGDKIDSSENAIVLPDDSVFTEEVKKKEESKQEESKEEESKLGETTESDQQDSDNQIPEDSETQEPGGTEKEETDEGEGIEFPYI